MLYDSLKVAKSTSTKTSLYGVGCMRLCATRSLETAPISAGDERQGSGGL